MDTKKEKLLNLDEVINRTSLKRSTIYALISNSQFPKQIHITSKRVVWIESEIDKWISTKIQNRN